MYTWFRVSMVRAMTGDPEGARAALRVMRDAWPDLAITHHALGYYAELTNDYAGAARHQEDAAAADPNYAVFGGMAAIDALEIGAFDTAQADLERLGRAESFEYVQPWMWLFIARGEPRRAVAWYRAQRFSPATLSRTRALLAQALALAGQREQALAEFRQLDLERTEKRLPLNDGGAHSLRLMAPENYVAMLPSGSPERAALLRELQSREALYRREGARYALMDYRAAVHAALAGRTDEAFGLLDVAIDHGYSSVSSLRRDLAWMSLRDDPRFKQRQARLEAIAATQRERLRSGAEG
jgi:tetratricopeptide (TPR) repeat protein